jgi:hypothetical protein
VQFAALHNVYKADIEVMRSHVRSWGQQFAALHNVCFWHKADIVVALGNVRFWG